MIGDTVRMGWIIWAWIIGAGLVALAQPVAVPDSGVATEAQPDTLVLCPLPFQAALQPWLDYRQRQGHVIQVVAPKTTAYEIRKQVAAVAETGGLKNLLIVGDVGRGSDQVVTEFRLAKVNVLFGSEPEIATDNPFADLDGDGVPDLAVGRLTVDSRQELTQLIARIIDYETSRDFSGWRRRVNVVAGVGGFDPITDKLIEQSASMMIGQFLPPGYPFSMTYGSWSSPYCPAPERFSETAIERFNEGCLFWVYTGHGSRHRLDSIYTPKGRYDILDNETVGRLACRSGSPIALMLCCYSGAIDDPEDCLAENMLRQPGGPIAVMCGTRVTMPYAMSLLSLELMSEHFEGDSQTLGELFLRAKQRLAFPDRRQPTFEMRELIQQLGMALSPTAELLEEELQEHLELFQLLGDPLLRLAKPNSVPLALENDPDDPSKLWIRGTAPFAGDLVVELCYDRNRFRSRPLYRRETDLAREGNGKFHDDYERHQNRICTAQKVQVTAGNFELAIDVPPDSSGDVIVRAFLQSESGHAIGACRRELPRSIWR